MNDMGKKTLWLKIKHGWKIPEPNFMEVSSIYMGFAYENGGFPYVNGGFERSENHGGSMRSMASSQ